MNDPDFSLKSSGSRAIVGSFRPFDRAALRGPRAFNHRDISSSTNSSPLRIDRHSLRPSMGRANRWGRDASGGGAETEHPDRLGGDWNPAAPGVLGTGYGADNESGT